MVSAIDGVRITAILSELIRALLTLTTMAKIWLPVNLALNETEVTIHNTIDNDDGSKACFLPNLQRLVMSLSVS